jgi:predicted DNA-binding transcriptional regulator YafY
MVAPDLLTTSAQACRDGERLEFDYTAADGTPTQRRSEPYRIVSVGRRWYLVAYDLDRHDWRSFRLDRMTGARSSGVRVAPRRLPAPDAASFVQAGLNQATTMRRVEVVVAAPADVVRERIGRWADIEVLDERRTGVRIHTDSWAWAALALAAVQSDFQVHGPDEFIEYLRGWNATLQRALPVP